MNDIGHGIAINDSIANLRILVETCRNYSVKNIVIMGIPIENSLADEFDEMCSDLTKEYQITYCDLMEIVEPQYQLSDSLHFNHEGNKFYSNQILDFLSKNS
jgi:lysophospholipase L1-like esterase